MVDKGFVPAYRKMYEPGHWLAPTKRDPACRRDAWMDLVQMATHAARETVNSGTLQRGELVASLRTLGARWCWSKDRVKRFTSDLEVRTAIETLRETPDGTVYRIENYDTYALGRDSERDTGSDSERDRSETGARQEQECNNEEEESPIGPLTAESDDGSEPKKRATRLPGDWTPTDSHRARALSTGLDLGREAEKFRLHAREKGRTALEWNSAFTRWLMNAKEYAKRGRSPPRGYRDPSSDTDWEAEAERINQKGA